MRSGFVLYGSYGFTGNLIAREAVRRGLRPVLAGRDGARLRSQATELDLEYRAFALDDTTAVAPKLDGVAAVLNCAGPFAHTFRPIAEACLRTGTHYLDITGEIPVFEALATMGDRARAAGSMLLPGAGFDVVPSDCLAAHLKERLPSATHLTLAFQNSGRASRGTMLTGLEGATGAGLVRRNGRLVRAPEGRKTRLVDFGEGPVPVVAIPWGDLSTAFHSTGIPNIETYAAYPRALRWGATIGRILGPLLRFPAVKSVLREWVRSQPPGPTDDERRRGWSRMWGEVRDEAGGIAVSRLRGPEGYSFTTLTAIAVVEKVLAGGVSQGFQTPSRVHGPDFVLSVPGVTREEVPPLHVRPDRSPAVP